MMLAGALGVLLTLSVLRTADDRRPVLVATRELAPGRTLTPEDVRVERVNVGGSMLSSLLARTDASSLPGKLVAEPVHAGMLVPRRAIRAADANDAVRVMSFPIARAHAVDGKLAAGDRVDVIAVERNGGRAGYVMTGAQVVAVDTRDGGPLAGASDDITLTLVVDPTLAPRLAAALDTGTVSVVRATGAPAFEPEESK
jgi:Flp pilus assembly protein CpaB